MKAEVLIEGLRFPEGPRWRDGRLFFSDMRAHATGCIEMIAVESNGAGLP